MGSNRRFAVAGFPVSHSKSPLIFNRLFSLSDIPGVYSCISAASGEEAVEIFNSLELTGMNITTPLKGEVMNAAEKTDEAADRIGCINTLFSSRGTLKGFNTDHLGVSGALSGEEISVRRKKCLVLGAGNAGRAAVHALVKMGGNVTVINRTYKKAHILAGDMNCRSEVVEKLHFVISDCDILVSTVTGGAEWIRKNWLKKETVVFDSNYLQSTLRETALAAGCRFIPGEAWLWNQAVPVFKIFTGEEIIHSAANDIRQLLETTLPPVSHIRLAGEKGCIESIKEELREQTMDIEVQTALKPEDFSRTETKNSTEERAYNILIYSGKPDMEKPFFSRSDLTVWGRGGIKDCSERILKEISHVR